MRRIRPHLGALLLSCLAATPSTAQDPPLTLEQLTVDMPDFSGYEAEYTSQSGRFLHQVRTFETESGPKVNVINLIHMPNGVIVDSRNIDRHSLALEQVATPYFAWGPEYLVAQHEGDRYEWLRVPLGGGEPIRVSGQSPLGPIVGDLGFSPVFASLLPLDTGARFALPQAQPMADGTIQVVNVLFTVVGTEELELDSGISCSCRIIEQRGSGGSVTRFWVDRQAPFVFRRHRDIGGPRDFVSDVLHFRHLP